MVRGDDHASPTLSHAAIAGAIEAARARIATAARQAGRDPASVTLVAVSKFHPAAAIEAARAAGQRHFGENRVQEAAAKFGPAAERTADRSILHVIGALQTNKARDAVRIADVIEVLDREKLAVAIDEAAAREGRVPRLLVQVNVGDETQKAGVARAEADGFIRACRARFGAALDGVMCIPPAGRDPAPYFRYLADLAGEHGLATLSMGMSDDCEVAIAAGATEVRIGTAIFGPRPPVTGDGA
jgi:pyridoxal phosphate enzyme (YggS family)